MDSRLFFLSAPAVRERACKFIRDEAPADWRVKVEPRAKKREQEERYHAMVNDIAQQWYFNGQRWDREDMKRLLIDLFAETMRLAGTPLHHDGRVVPSIDGKRIVQLGIQSRKFYVKEASEFIEFLFALGAEKGIEWSDPTMRRQEEEA